MLKGAWAEVYVVSSINVCVKAHKSRSKATWLKQPSATINICHLSAVCGTTARLSAENTFAFLCVKLGFCSHLRLESFTCLMAGLAHLPSCSLLILCLSSVCSHIYIYNTLPTAQSLYPKLCSCKECSYIFIVPSTCAFPTSPFLITHCGSYKVNEVAQTTWALCISRPAMQKAVKCLGLYSWANLLKIAPILLGAWKHPAIHCDLQDAFPDAAAKLTVLPWQQRKCWRSRKMTPQALHAVSWR